ncbi:MAG: phage portal protein [Terricaulis sp.]
MAVVASGGSLVAVGRGETLIVPRGVTLYAGSSATYETIWRTQPAVRTVTSFLGRNIAQLGVAVYRRRGDNDRERLSGHPLAATLTRPNPATTRYELIDALVQDLAIYDEAYWLKVRTDSGQVGLVRIPPRKVTPVGDNWLAAEGFKVSGMRGDVTFSADQVVQFKGYNPADPRTGVSPIETLRRILAEEQAAAEYRERFWRTGARVSSVIKRPSDAPDWSEDARGRFLAEWRDAYSGDGAGVGGTPLLEDGMTLEAAGHTAEQAQYLGARKLTREEVVAAYHIPLPMVGILDHATFSNVREQHKQLYQDTLGPWLEMLTQRIEHALLPEYADTRDVYVEFNLEAKMRGDFEEQSSSMSTMVGAPVMTRNEGRARLNLSPVAGGDELVTPLNVLVGGQASPTDSAPPPKASGPLVKAAVAPRRTTRYQDTLTAFFGRQQSVVASKLGGKARKASLADVFDQERWDRELAADLFRVNVGAAVTAAKAVLDAAGTDPATFDDATITAWLQANAEASAHAINTVTGEQLGKALAADDPKVSVADVFAVAISARAAQIAMTQSTAIAGFGGHEGAKGAGLNRKRWEVRSSNPRPAHSRLNGEVRTLDEKFSNGAKWPGDSVLGADDRAGCTCDVTFFREDG